MKHQLHGAGRISAILTAFLLAGTLAACGQKDKSSTAPDESGTAAVSQTGEPGDSTGENPSQSGGEDDPSGGDSTGENQQQGGEQQGGEQQGGEAQQNPSGGEDAPAKTDAKSGNGGSSKTTTAASGGSSSGSRTTAKTNSGSGSGGNTVSTPNDDDPDLDPTDEEKPTKYINLTGSSARFSGDGIAVSGSKITISKGGHYEISGTLDNGQIYIETDKKKVKLLLNNCSITNKSGAAIYCQQAKKVTLESLPGTTSTISDGGTHDEDKGAVFSEDTVVLKGEGTINIKGVYAHGVKSDDDIRVDGGTVNITATKSCLYANDAIEINGGTLFCDGGTNGIKTSKPESMITVNGGSSIMIGGERDEKGAISSAGTFTVTGGSLWAIGNSSTLPDAATTANMLILTFSNSQAANSAVQVTSGSSPIFAMTSPHPYRYVFYAGTNLQSNATYSVRYGGSLSGAKNYVTNGSGYSGGSDGGSFKADRKVATHNIS